MTNPEQPLTPTELRMLRVARTFAAEGRLTEQGRPVRESRLIDLVRRMSAIRQPAARPRDREVRTQPSSREAATALPRNRRPVSNAPTVIPPPPDGSAAGLECDAVDCPEVSVGWRFYRTEGWLLACVRHMSGAGPAVRRMDAEQRATFGPGDAGAEGGAVWPPAASEPSDQARGASGAERAAEGPPGAFPETVAASMDQGCPENRPPLSPDGLTGHGSPSGPIRSSEAHTEPYSPAAPQAVTQAVQA